MGVTDDSIKLYQAIANKQESRVMKSWHASMLSECPRAQYIKRDLGGRLDEKIAQDFPGNIPSAAKQMRWDAGHTFEEVIRPYLPSIFPENETISSNKRLFSLKYDLTGEYDNYAHDSRTLVEIKTVHDWAFIERGDKTYLKEQDGEDERGRKRWKPKKEPYLHHAIQNHAYAILLKANSGEAVEKIKYVYLSLSGRIVTYETPIQPAMLKKVLKRLAILNKAWEDKQPPECICDESHPLWGPVMQYCDFRTDTGCCLVDKE